MRLSMNPDESVTILKEPPFGCRLRSAQQREEGEEEEEEEALRDVGSVRRLVIHTLSYG